MTFSLCAREPYVDASGEERVAFGVIVTTRLPCVGSLCPFASPNGALSVQSDVDPAFGRRAIRYVDEGLAIDDACGALLVASERAPTLQVHGVDREGEFVYSGSEARDWYGHRHGENYTAAGNLLAGESVVEETVGAYEAGDRDRPLARRLVDALEAGHEAGGDRREDLRVQSVAMRLRTTGDAERGMREAYYDHARHLDLRVDASETPIADLRGRLDLAVEGLEAARARRQG